LQWSHWKTEEFSSSSDRDEEFELLDEEFEALINNTSSRSRGVSMNSPHVTQKEEYPFGDDFALNILNLNCSSNNGWNLTLKKKETSWNQAPMTSAGPCSPTLSSNMGPNASSNQLCPYCRSFSIPSPQRDAMGNRYKPDHAHMSCGRVSG
jgi:hypothetical protein